MPSRPVRSHLDHSRNSGSSAPRTTYGGGFSFYKGPTRLRTSQKGFSFAPSVVHVSNATPSSSHFQAGTSPNIGFRCLGLRLGVPSETKWLSSSRLTRKCTILGFLELPLPTLEIIGRKHGLSRRVLITNSSTSLDRAHTHELQPYSLS
jgi:hypothetical protein